MSANQDGLNIYSTGRLLLGSIATFATTAFIVSAFTTGPLIAGIFGGFDSAVAWFLLLAAVAWLGYNTDEISVGFTFSAVAIALLLTQHILPGWLTRPFAPISQVLIGRQLGGVSATRFAVLVAGLILAYWAFRVRAFGRGKKPSTIVKRLRQKSEQLVREYVTIGRVTVAFGFSAAYIVAGQLGQLSGELAGMLAGGPVMAGYAATIGGIWGRSVAGIPVLSGLSGIQFLWAVFIIFVVAVGVKYQ